MAVRICSVAGLMMILAVPMGLAVPTGARAEGIFSRGTPDAGTPEYYQYHCNSPVGSRQVCCKGKLWPPRPRPTGPHQPCAHKYHAATYWPWPYVCQDRMIVNSTEYAQIENGWICATTFYDYHFNPETHGLNSAGRRHLEWMLTFVPVEYRRAYVSSTASEQTSDLRVASVESEMSHLLGNGETLPIELRVTQPLQRNAIDVEQIHRAANENRPVPSIEYQPVSAN